MSNTNKDTIYIDVDDEITAIIDKVSDSPQKIVALVLPKRATALQSIVNMKLLKRSADDANKNLVLVTNEPSLLPLAGSVGLHVAKTPQSKPEVPAGPAEAPKEPEQVDESEADGREFDSKSNAATPVGALAAASNADDEPIEFDNADPTQPPDGKSGRGKTSKKGKAAGVGKQKKLKIPNFHKFRSRLGLAIVGGVALIALLVYALVALPSATIAIATDTEEIDNTLDVTFDATAEEVNAENVVVPSVVERIERTNSETVAASGQRNDGDRAEGDVMMTLCASSMGEVQDIPAGTGVSTGGNNYITQETAEFDFAFSNCDGDSYLYETQKVDIVAQEGGKKYNVKNTTFSVAGSNAKGEGSAKGGTDDIVKIVSEEDVDSATQKLESQTDDSAKEELSRRLEDRSLYIIEDSFNASEAETSTSVPVGSETDEVTVTQKTTYTMLGVEKADLEDLITKVVEQDIDTERQSVLNTGVDNAVFQLQNEQDNGAKVLMSMDITSVAGPELDDATIKEQVKGKKSAEAEELIGEYPGVTTVEVTYGPFWVSSIPSNADKITITYED